MLVDGGEVLNDELSGLCFTRSTFPTDSEGQ